MRPLTAADIGETVLYRHLSRGLRNVQVREVYTNGNVGVDLNGAILQVTQSELFRARKVARHPDDYFPPVEPTRWSRPNIARNAGST